MAKKRGLVMAVLPFEVEEGEGELTVLVSIDPEDVALGISESDLARELRRLGYDVAELKLDELEPGEYASFLAKLKRPA